MGEPTDFMMTEPKYGYLRQDDSGHWYLIPEELRKDFRELLDTIETCDYPSCENAEDKFIRDFDKYRLSGGYQDLRIFMGRE